MNLQNHTINFYKLQAKKLKRELDVKHTEALNLVAKNYGFSNWIDCQRSIGSKTESVSKIIPINFTSWLRKQLNRNSPLGDLARDMEKDTKWPLYDDLELYNKYLHSRGVSDNVLVALKNAWKSFNVNLKRNLLPKKEKKVSKRPIDNPDQRRITIVKNIKPIHFDNRKSEKFDVGDKAWISWNGRKALPVTITEVTDRNYSFNIERPLKHKGNNHFLFLDEVCSTPELACINHVTL